MTKSKPRPPKQIEPLLDPNAPDTANRVRYFILNEPQSPTVAPPNAVRWQEYDVPRMLRQNDPDDDRVAWGFIEYEEKVTWQELKEYNMLPFNYDESILFDLWQSFDEDKDKLMDFLGLFFTAVEGDTGLRRLGLALKLLDRDWTLKRARLAVEEIKSQ